MLAEFIIKHFWWSSKSISCCHLNTKISVYPLLYVEEVLNDASAPTELNFKRIINTCTACLRSNQDVFDIQTEITQHFLLIERALVFSYVAMPVT